ncbi:MAG TPA: amidophosphoribosyltransferase, partial [Bacteroidales bacterium]|nr:amidophosphoribosyltransferase [Bacteroidales bacterium]
WLYGLHKLYLLMEKQHNRGQDGAGVAAVKFDMDPGMPYIFRHRSIEQNAIDDVFRKISKAYRKLEKKDQELMSDVTYVKSHIPFAAELYLGHLRYGTFGGNTLDYVHPVMRQNNWRSRNLVMAGNFNLTNVDEIFSILVDLGQHPKDFSDTVTILENVGHFLDTEVQRKFNQFKAEGYNNREISFLIEENLDVSYILRESSKKWDGGYAIIGMIGHGDAFVMRDPWGIRPAFYYKDEEVAVVASERPVIQTVFNVPYEQVHEIPAGNALIIKKKGDVFLSEVREPKSKKSCSFERIYFSRGSDRDIYRERKALGELLVPSILKAVDYDLDHTVFSYIPNTAETAFYGMIKGIERYMLEETFGSINGRNQMIGKEELTAILYRKPRVEKVAIKDIRLRTFISQDKGRDDLVEHVYDITYGTLEPGVDNLVIIDDSIVRGTTLKKSILRILDRLGPKKIVVVSSSPQIRYPDCYGIDMAKLGDFIAFRAAVRLLQDTSQHKILNEVYRKCKEQQHKPKEEIVNYVKEIYAPFSDEEISAKIAELLKTEGIKAEVRIVYQTVENLHKACPNHTGDWYFTGDYPTPGGNKVVNTSFINFMEGRNQRAY